MEKLVRGAKQVEIIFTFKNINTIPLHGCIAIKFGLTIPDIRPHCRSAILDNVPSDLKSVFDNNTGEMGCEV